MQNSQIWKSIEALCDEAETVIKSGDNLMAVIQSTAPPAIADQKKTSPPTTSPQTISVLPSKPAPVKVTIVNKLTQNKTPEISPLSSATMSEIAAAVKRASQSQQNPEKTAQPSQTIDNQTQKDLITEVSQAVSIVLANELPQIVHQAISQSMREIITTSTKPVPNKLAKSNLELIPKARKKIVSTKKKSSPIKTPTKKVKPKDGPKKADT